MSESLPVIHRKLHGFRGKIVQTWSAAVLHWEVEDKKFDQNIEILLRNLAKMMLRQVTMICSSEAGISKNASGTGTLTDTPYSNHSSNRLMRYHYLDY
jgi:hypothetical protein